MLGSNFPSEVQFAQQEGAIATPARNAIISFEKQINEEEEGDPKSMTMKNRTPRVKQLSPNERHNLMT